MIYLLRLLIFGHVHKWQTVDYGNVSVRGYIKGMWFHERCQVCGMNRYKQRMG